VDQGLRRGGDRTWCLMGTDGKFWKQTDGGDGSMTLWMGLVMH
jgi:hypothetical protein